MRTVALVVTAAVFAASAGCAALSRNAFQEPVVTFRNVEVNGVGLDGGSLNIVLGVYNPNRLRLDATRMTYNLFVDTVPFGSGATDSNFTVQSGDTAVVRLPLTFTWSGIGRAARELMHTGTVPYRVTGDITVGSSVGAYTLRYDRTGRFSALRGSGR